MKLLARMLAAACLLAAAGCGEAEIPLVYDCENSGASFATPALPEMAELPAIDKLPDPFLSADGSWRVRNFAQWERRRSEILAQIQHYEIGTKPVTPKSCVAAHLEDSTLVVTVNVRDTSLTMRCRVSLPEGDGPHPAVIGIGFGSGSLPRSLFAERNVAMVAFPFWEVMEHTQTRGVQPINALYPELADFGAYAAWSWGVSRLIDGLELVADQLRIDTRRLAVTGCSFAGKMALFAGAFDERIALTIAQEPGGGGAAAWRVSETLGNVETIARTNYAWFLESMRQFSEENCAKLPVDHHELCALVAPRALFVIGNPDYEWLADEAGYVSCAAALKVWERFGIDDRFGYSFQQGHMHCQLPEEQCRDVGAFLDKCLLGRDDTDTRIRRAPMFAETQLDAWIDWQ